MNGAATGNFAADASVRFVSRQSQILVGEPAPVGQGGAFPGHRVHCYR